MSAEQINSWKEEITQEGMLWLELADLKTKQSNLRRGLFQRLDELQREIDLLKNQIISKTPKKD